MLTEWVVGGAGAWPHFFPLCVIFEVGMIWFFVQPPLISYRTDDAAVAAAYKVVCFFCMSFIVCLPVCRLSLVSALKIILCMCRRIDLSGWLVGWPLNGVNFGSTQVHQQHRTTRRIWMPSIYNHINMNQYLWCWCLRWWWQQLCFCFALCSFLIAG